MNRPFDTQVPPSELRGRVLRALGERGMLRPRRSAPWGWVLRAVAAVVLFAGGWWTANDAGEPAAAEGTRWLLLLYEDASFRPNRPASELVAEYREWAKSVGGVARVEGGERLGAAEDVVMSGAHADDEPGSLLAGFFIVRAPTREDAVAVARRSPHVRYGGEVRIRAIEGN